MVSWEDLIRLGCLERASRVIQKGKAFFFFSPGSKDFPFRNASLVNQRVGISSLVSGIGLFLILMIRLQMLIHKPLQMGLFGHCLVVEHLKFLLNLKF